MAQTAPSAALLEHLRDQIQKVQAAPRRYLAELKTGLVDFDALHALQLGTVVELCGEAASGRTSLALRAVAAAANESRLSAWVDGPLELYPPGAAALGVDLRRLLVVRPKEPGRLVWTACQLARSGAFAAVVADFTHTAVRLSLADAQKLGEAARKGGTLLLILTAPEAPGEGLVKLLVRPTPPPPPVIAVHPERGAAESNGCPDEPTGIEVEVTRSRAGAMGRTFSLRRNELLEGRAPPLRRCLRVSRDSAPAKFLEALLGGMQRPKKNLLRDGHGLCATRPGRDGPFQPMNLGPRTMAEARKKNAPREGDALKSLPGARSFH